MGCTRNERQEVKNFNKHVHHPVGHGNRKCSDRRSYCLRPVGWHAGPSGATCGCGDSDLRELSVWVVALCSGRQYVLVEFQASGEHRTDFEISQKYQSIE